MSFIKNAFLTGTLLTFIKQIERVKHSTMLTRHSWLKVCQTTWLESLSNPCQNLKKIFFSQMLKPSNFGSFILHNPMSPGNMLKREHCDAVNDSKIRIIVACKAKLNWYFLVLNLQSWGSCEVIVNFPFCCILTWRYNWYKHWIIFLTASVLRHWSKFRRLVFDLPCFLWTKIYTYRPSQKIDLYQLISSRRTISLFFYIYPHVIICVW